MTVKDSQPFQVDTSNDVEKQVTFLVVETRGELYAVRWALVEEARVLLDGEIDFSTQPPEVHRNGHSFPLCYLWELVELSPPREKLTEVPAVFLEEGEGRMVLVPERILWRQEASIKELPSWLNRAPSVKGAIVLDSGVVVIVLEPLESESGNEEAK